MREERKRQETKMLNKLRGYEEYKYDEDEIEEKEIDDEEEKKPSLLKKVIMFIIFLIILVVVYSIYIEPKYFLKVNEYGVKINNYNEKINGLKIVHFADIHYGTTIGKKELNRVIKEINEIEPDIVIYSGDLFDKNIKLNSDSKNYIIEMFSGIEAKLYKYAIYGDEDYKEKDEYKNILESSNFILLDNQAKVLYVDDVPIVIAGINDSETNDYGFINSTEDKDYSSYFRIVIDHKIDNVDKYLDKNPDLVITSHSLGGIVRIPFIGGIINLDEAKKYKDNYNKSNNTIIYNSYGLGTSNWNFRFNNFPSIDLYRIYKG